MNMNMKYGVTLFACALSACLQADTVLWYRLDGFAPGEKTTSSTHIDNLANPGHDQAVCHSFTTTRGTDASWMPYGTNGIASNVAIYDPATGIVHPRNPYALHFGLTTVTSSDADGYGGFLRLNPSGLALTNITVEAVFRLAPGDYSSWSFAPIVMQEGSSASSEGWVVTAAGYQNKLVVRFNCCEADGSGVAQKVITGISVPPGEWHHVAFTFDAGGVVNLYLDYVRVGGGTFAGKRLATYETKALTIGANNGQQKRTFPGDVMEVRISDVALAMDDFLRVREAPRASGSDAATLAHVAFEGDYSVSPYYLCPTNGWGVARDGGNVPTFSDKVPGSGMIALDGAAENDIVRSTRSVRMEGSSVRFERMFAAEKRKFTVECFAKIEAADLGVGFLRQGRLEESYESDQPRWMLYLSPYSSHINRLYLAITAENGRRDDVGFADMDSSFADGKWHHYALTFDESVSEESTTNAIVTLWRDYKSLGTRTVVQGRIAMPSVPCTFTIGANNNFTGWVDELRITDGVLPASAFMRAMPKGMMLNFR